MVRVRASPNPSPGPVVHVKARTLARVYIQTFEKP